jgi:hypothetical protein
MLGLIALGGGLFTVVLFVPLVVTVLVLVDSVSITAAYVLEIFNATIPINIIRVILNVVFFNKFILDIFSLTTSIYELTWFISITIFIHKKRQPKLSF